jgi:hypothetical protein
MSFVVIGYCSFSNILRGIFNSFTFFFFLAVMGIELRALQELYHLSLTAILLLLVYFSDRVSHFYLGWLWP